MRLYITFISCLVLSNILSAQDIMEPAIPSPNASKIAQFDLHPPNLYTGAMGYGIPIHTMEEEGLGLNISLSYHGGGFRVGEEASFVGLGWALSFGGSISRSINGYDDLNTNIVIGYPFDPVSIPDYVNRGLYIRNEENNLIRDPNQEHVEYWWDHLWGKPNRDTEPDVFTYNYLGSSGKFVLSKKSETNNTIEVIKLQENADKIIFDENNKTFTVISPFGHKGVFSIKEYSFSIGGTNSLNDFSACNDNLIDFLQVLNSNGRSISSWYLSEIETYKGRKIFFEYDLFSDQQLSEYVSISSKNWKEVNSINTTYLNIGPVIDGLEQSCSMIVTENVYLKKIHSSFFKFSIDLLYSPRMDIEILGGTFSRQQWANQLNNHRNSSNLTIKQALKLDSIIISNGNNPIAPSKRVKLKNSYFINAGLNDPENTRLRLDEVWIDDQNYSFTYFNEIPSKASWGIDYWGYYNGNDNNVSLRPALSGYFALPNAFRFTASLNTYIQSENRKSDFDFGKFGLLHTIQLPTGGKLLYEYEGNSYRVEENEIVIPRGSNSIIFSSGLAKTDLPYREETFVFKGFGVDGCNSGLNLKLSAKCKDFFLRGGCYDDDNSPRADTTQRCAIDVGDYYKPAVEVINPSGLVIYTILFEQLWARQVSCYERNYELNIVNDSHLLPGTYRVRTYGVYDESNSAKYYGDITVNLPVQCNGDLSPFESEVRMTALAGGARVKSIGTFQGDTLIKKVVYKYEDSNNKSSGLLLAPLLITKFIGRDHPDSIPILIETSGSALTKINSNSPNHVGYSVVKEIEMDGYGLVNSIRKHHFFNAPYTISTWGESNWVALAREINPERNGKLFKDSVLTSEKLLIKRKTNEYEFVQTRSINAIKINYFGFGRPDMMTKYEIIAGADQLKQITTVEYERDPVTQQSYANENYEQFEYTDFNLLSRKMKGDCSFKCVC